MHSYIERSNERLCNPFALSLNKTFHLPLFLYFSHVFPTLSLLPAAASHYLGYLIVGKFCCFSYKDYNVNIEWLGNCSNPEDLFENVVDTQSNLIHSIEPMNYFYSRSSFYMPQNDEENLEPFKIESIDRRVFARCFAVKLTDPQIAF